MRQLHQNKLLNGDMCEQDFESSDNFVDHMGMGSKHYQSLYNCGECEETFEDTELTCCGS